MVLDEYRVFLAKLRTWYPTVKGKGAPSVPPCIELYGNLIRMGRTAGVHLITGVQRPDADQLGGEVRDNFHARVSLGPLSPDGAKMCWEAAHIGTSVPKLQGRGTAVGADGAPVEMQAYWTPDPHPRKMRAGSEDEQLLASLAPPEGASLWEPLVVIPPEDPDHSEHGSAYAAFAAAEFGPRADHPEVDTSGSALADMENRLSPSIRALGAPGRAGNVPASEGAGGEGQRWHSVPSQFEEIDLEDTSDYEVVESVLARELIGECSGLVLVDDQATDPLEAWGVIEGVEIDTYGSEQSGTDYVCLSWRHRVTGASDVTSLPPMST